MTADDETTRRIALAWRELRRGGHETTLRLHLLGPDTPLLEQAQLDALEILATEPDGWRMSEFAEALRVDPSTATRAVDRLERIGFAERVSGTEDRRVVLAKATAKGAQTVERVALRRAVGMERLLETFDQGEREDLADQLERFVASVDELVAQLGRENNRP